MKRSHRAKAFWEILKTSTLVRVLKSTFGSIKMTDTWYSCSLCHWHDSYICSSGADENGATCSPLFSTLHTYYCLTCCLEMIRKWKSSGKVAAIRWWAIWTLQQMKKTLGLLVNRLSNNNILWTCNNVSIDFLQIEFDFLNWLLNWQSERNFNDMLANMYLYLTITW